MDVDLPRLRRDHTTMPEPAALNNGNLIAAHDLHFAYNVYTAVLNGVGLSVRMGEVVALLGANGSGKSTLLKLLLGLLEPSTGSVYLDGRRLSAWSRREIARRIAYVPQSQAMPFPYTVRDLVALGRIPHVGLVGRLSARDHDAVDKAMVRLSIEGLAGCRFTQLSGGQRQLGLIARALAQEVPLVVMDEPDGGLDYGNQWRLLGLVEALAAEGRAFVLSSHHPDHVLGSASRAVLLHQGRVVADGVPAEVVTPENMLQLYGLRVGSHALPDGRVVLAPDKGMVTGHV